MKKVLSVLIVMVFVVAVMAPAFAATEPSGPAVDVAQKSAKYTGNVVTGSVNTVGEAAKGTTETAVSPFKALWSWMTGKGEGKKIVTDPVNQGGKTVYDTTVNTGKTLEGKK